MILVAAEGLCPAQSANPDAIFREIENSLGEILWSARDRPVRTPALCIDESARFISLTPEGKGIPDFEPESFHGSKGPVAVKLLARHPATGLCLVKAEKPGSSKKRTPPVSLAEMNAWPTPGSAVIVLCGRDVESCIAGRIAGRDMIYDGEELPATLLRVNLEPSIEAPPGSPVVDEKGRLLGLMTGRKLENPGEFHAVPVVLIEKLLRDYASLGRSADARWGAFFRSGSTTPQVVSVRKGSPAEKAGLEPGDVILRIGERPVTRLSDLIEALRTLTAFEAIEVEILRGVKTRNLQLVPEATP